MRKITQSVSRMQNTSMIGHNSIGRHHLKVNISSCAIVFIIIHNVITILQKMVALITITIHLVTKQYILECASATL